MTHKPDNPPAYVRVVVTPVSSETMREAESIWRRLLQYILKERKNRHDD